MAISFGPKDDDKDRDKVEVEIKEKTEVKDDKVKKKSHAGAIAGLIIFLIVVAFIA
jgi:hypothetical protein